MTTPTDKPTQIWLDLTQKSLGYSSDPEEVREGDTEYIRADLILKGKPDLARLRAEMSETCAMLTDAAAYLEATLREEVTDAADAERLARALRNLAGEV